MSNILNQNNNLIEVTRNLLKNRNIVQTYELIGKNTGLTKGWLVRFTKGDQKDFGANKVQKLYEYLKGIPLL